MAVFHITPSNSVFTSASGDIAFASGTFGSDTLIVDPGAFLWAAGNFSTAVMLNAPGNWTVTVNGTIRADGNISVALDLGPGMSGMSSITVGAGGEITSPQTGIIAESPIKLTNAGEISGGGLAGVLLENNGANVVTNTGTINLIDNFYNGSATITNSGTIGGISNSSGGSMVVKNSGTVSDFISGSDSNTTTVTNTGTIAQVVDVTSLTNSKTIIGDAYASKLTNSGGIGGDVGAATVTNKGEIGGDVSGRDVTNSKTIAGDVRISDTLTNSGSIGGDVSNSSLDEDNTVTNKKTITGSVSLSGGTNKLTNSGTIGADVDAGTIFDPDSINTIVNSKTIVGSVTFHSGTNSLKNSGSIGGDITAFEGDDTVANSKTIGGAVKLGDGANKLTNSGAIQGDVIGGAGVDTIVNSKTLSGSVNFGDGQDALTNSGTIAHDITFGVGADQVKNTGSILGVIVTGGDLLLNGTGKISSVNAGAKILGSDGHSITITNNGNSVHGEGVVGDSHVDFINAKGTIVADINGHELSIQSHIFSNGGVLEALNGGILAIETDITSVSAAAKIIASGAGSVIQLDGLVTGGAVSIAKMTDLEILHGAISGAKITNAGHLTVFDDVTIAGSIANTGALEVENHHLTIQGAVSGAGTANIGGTGILEFGAASSAKVNFIDGGAGSLVLDTATKVANKFTGTIIGFSHDDDIQLVALFDANTATVSQSFAKTTGGTVTVTDAQSHSVSLTFVGDFTHETFAIQDDSHHPGHIDLVLV